MKRVLVFGTFDLLHQGHRYFLKKARKKGSRLVVSVARDDSIRSQKGREPYRHEGERIAALLETGIVHEAHLSDANVGSFQIIQRTRPDVVCFGHDQTHLKENLELWLRANSIDIPTYVIDAHHPDRFKSSKIIIKRNAGT